MKVYACIGLGNSVALEAAKSAKKAWHKHRFPFLFMCSITWYLLPLFQPIFLHRTLTYMRSRQSPRNNARLGGFKIDSMLERKMKETHENLELMKPFMTLTFLGLYEKKSKYLLLQVRKALATFTGYAHAGRRPLPWLDCNVARAWVP